jgi:hypothetical protein
MLTKNMNELENIDPGLKEILSAVEKETNSNFYFTDILRTKEELKTIPGAWSGSMHVDWDDDGDSQAVDIRRSSFVGSPESYARKLYAQGATGIGIYDTHIHVDNNPDRLDNPYFKDYRTKKTEYDETINISGFNFFKNFFNKSLAENRIGSTNKEEKVVVVGGARTKINENSLVQIGLAVVSILVLVGLLDSSD